ncbi:MAG: hypothetical protein LBU50_04325, partial [Cellulomonas sp.]|nr:hypothetical protein [Cellulomonas sp.]
MGESPRSPKVTCCVSWKGNAEDIDREAWEPVEAAGVMQETADALRRLADGTDTVAHGRPSHRG